MTPQFQNLVDEYVRTPGISDDLKVASLSQWILESGRGESDLAQEHLNFGGLKWRESRMEGINARPVEYEASDGVDTYAAFADLPSFLDGYWAFITKGPYEHPSNYEDDAVGYIEMLVNNEPPYATDPNYANKVVSLFPEATELLGLVDRPPPVLGVRLGVVVGHNRTAQGAYSSHLGISEWPFNTRIAELMASEAAKYSITMETFFRTPEGGVTAEINRAYAEVDAWGADLILELHFNGASPSANGTETLHWHTSTKGRTFAQHVQRACLDAYGLRDRGLKPIQSGGAGAISLTASASPTILGEPFFGSNSGDCAVVQSRGEMALATAYLRGVRDAAIDLDLMHETEPPPPPPPGDTVKIELATDEAQAAVPVLEDMLEQMQEQLDQ